MTLEIDGCAVLILMVFCCQPADFLENILKYLYMIFVTTVVKSSFDISESGFDYRVRFVTNNYLVFCMLHLYGNLKSLRFIERFVLMSVLDSVTGGG